MLILICCALFCLHVKRTNLLLTFKVEFSVKVTVQEIGSVCRWSCNTAKVSVSPRSGKNLVGRCIVVPNAKTRSMPSFKGKESVRSHTAFIIHYSEQNGPYSHAVL